MANTEFYIRNASETDARGPFTVEQLLSLAEAGQVTPETLYYDATTEQWIAIGDENELRAQIFPEKKKLTIKRESKLSLINKTKEGEANVDVNDMLAAAEGRTAETKGKRRGIDMIERCAKLGSFAVMLTLLCFMAGEISPAIDVLVSPSVGGFLSNPLLVLGLLDLLLTVIIFLGVISFYPFIRFRAMLGLGFTGTLYWVLGMPTEFGFAAAGCIGLYCSTVFTSYVPSILSAILGICGSGALAYLMIFEG
jgi:hypothetical protein